MMGEELSDDWVRHITGWPFLNARPKRLGVAVSGGGDSMACLDLMLWHGREKGFPVEAVTVDHGLRSEAADEIALVAEFCAARNVPHSVLRWHWDRTGNLQAEARAARYRLIAAWARERGVDRIALGHTQDDVAETFLMRLARASGIDGLSAMERRFERDGLTWVRPIMAHGREDWRAYLKRQGILWAEDASNEDEGFDRVKARKVLKALGPLGIDADALASVANNLSVARSALEMIVQDVAHRYVAEDRGDLILPGDTPEDDRVIPYEITFRLRRHAIRWIGGGDYSPRSDSMIELDMAIDRGATHTLGGCVFTRRKGRSPSETRWRITREFNAVKDLATRTDALWDGRWRLAGPHAPDLEIRALGEAVKDTPWRETGMPRASLMASPAVWRGESLVAAPVAGRPDGWTAEATGRGNFADFLLRR
jgi:tRNA(Ile)-lysidine synthase